MREYIGKTLEVCDKVDEITSISVINRGVCLYADSDMVVIKDMNKEVMKYYFKDYIVRLSDVVYIDMQYPSREEMVSITKEMEFASAHHLRYYEGKCSNLHGHNYKLQVTVTGTLDSIGMVLDFGVLKQYMKEVDKVLDHQNLDEVLDFQSTAENMVCFIADFINVRFVLEGRKCRVTRVKLYETSTSFAEWEGEIL